MALDVFRLFLPLDLPMTGVAGPATGAAAVPLRTLVDIFNAGDCVSRVATADVFRLPPLPGVVVTAGDVFGLPFLGVVGVGPVAGRDVSG